MRLNRLPGASRFLEKGDIVPLTHPPFGSGSAELHLNLRHYRNYQAWDSYLLTNRLFGGSLKLEIFDQLSKGQAILCCCKEGEPFSYAEATCGAITLKTDALTDGWQYSTSNRYWYCPVCKMIRLSSKSYHLLTRDSL